MSNSQFKIAAGTIHTLPADLYERLVAEPEVLEVWQGLTPLARNEWICWVEDAKKAQTREKRLQRLSENLKEGKRRPCCWPGCSHRDKSARAG